MRKRFLKYILFGALLMPLASCQTYLDVNEPNPNTATESTPDLILPQAMAYIATNYVSYHDYGNIIVYLANAGGYGGWGWQHTYDINNSQFNGFFNNVYDNVLDLEYIINNSTEGVDANYIASAKILKAYLYLMLVNEYNDVPFTEGAKGPAFVTPKYDNAKEIYKGLADLLDEAIADIKAAPTGVARPMPSSADIIFKGNMTRWIEFANTLKLKLYVFAHGESVFTGNPTFSPEGFLKDDVLVNPGYQKLDGKQNPTWNTYHSTYTQSAQVAYGRQYLPNRYALTFYDGNKISDAGRGAATYRLWPSVATNYMGNTPTPDNLPTISGTLGSSPFYIGTPGATTGAVNTIGVLKGLGMGQPIMLANESYLLQAEAVVRGIISGDAAALFKDGIKASFTYLFKNAEGVVAADKNPTAATDSYITTNVNSPLVNFSLATDNNKKIEAIVTQKYIAHNFIGGHIAWADFRRTGYPTIVANGSSTQTFVSPKSNLNTVDRLPGRILYPTSEYTLNAENVPTGISVGSSFVFWDRRSN